MVFCSRAPILVSGDIHFAQLLRKDCRKSAAEGDPDNGTIRSLYEVTTSGMTHSWGSKHGYCARVNKSKLCKFAPFRNLLKSVLNYAHIVNPWTALLKRNDDSGNEALPENMKRLQYTLDRNIAEFEFDFTNRTVLLRVLGETGETLLREDWSMDRLSTNQANNTILSREAFAVGQSRLESAFQKPLLTNHNEFVCVNYRGNPNRIHFALGTASTFGLFVFTGMSPFLVCICILAIVVRRFRRSSKEE